MTLLFLFSQFCKTLFHFTDVMEGNIDSNFAYCPPEGNYGTIDSYPWECGKGPNGKRRFKAPYFSNPKVCYQGVPTGDAYNNNAEFISRNRFKTQKFGTNCLDGNPTPNWKYKSNCNGEQTFFEPQIDYSKG